MKMTVEDGTLKKCLLEPNETRLDVPEGVTRIGKGALWQIELEEQRQGWPPGFIPRCEELQDLTLPEGLTEIGMGAFMGCASLKRVRFPRSLRHIGSFAFSNCEALEEIELPEGLLKIGFGAFSYCNLRKLSLPESLQRVGRDAFYNCPLEDVRVPGPVRIASSAFGGFKMDRAELELGPLAELSRGLRNGLLEPAYGYVSPVKPHKPNPRYLLHGSGPIVPEGVTHIGESAFRNLRYRSISLPKGLTSIAAHAFQGCDELKTLVLPSTLKHIGDFAFAGCVKLRKLVIPEGLESVGSRAFADVDRPLSDREMFDFTPEGQRPPVYHALSAHLLPESVRFIDGYPFDPAGTLDPVFIRYRLAQIAPYLHPKTLMKFFLYQPSDAAQRKLEEGLFDRLNFVDFTAIAHEINAELRRVRTREAAWRAEVYYMTFLADYSPDELVAHVALMRELGFETEFDTMADKELAWRARAMKPNGEGEA